MRIQIFTDAWHPQVNGVVRTLSTTQKVLTQQGHQVEMVHPQLFKTFPCPTYKEIRLAIQPSGEISHLISAFNPQAIHIATEGPIGWAARSFCLQHHIPFSTAYHTQFPEYLKARTGLPRRWIYQLLRYFHKPAVNVMVPTPSIIQNLQQRGFHRLALWTRGVDTELFCPQDKINLYQNENRPILLYVGRVAVEKNLTAFLNLKTDGKKVVVGDGPLYKDYKLQYPDVDFVGVKTGKDLVTYYNAADVFVFPSLTDTFGLVMLEALACGVPVAAFPVPGPQDVILNRDVGCLDFNLEKAVQNALKLSRKQCRNYALGFSWQKAANQFLNHLQPIY
jgi:glycosyltransferase involved in cell wall biosynthesis